DEGDFSIDAEPTGLAARRRAVVDLPWVWLRQVHGADLVVVTSGNASDLRGTEADALVTAEPNLVLAVQTADCVPVELHGTNGVVGLAHAGWRSIEAGVIERTVEAMAALGSYPAVTTIGPHIGPECYEFGATDLDRLAARFGDGVRSTTSDGRASLDLVRMVRAALHRAGAGAEPQTSDPWPANCTACHADRWFSHRARGETERMATVVWREP
ncbi:MAG TPA: polyphenol oxidase family protein, partial [Acidimicrobiales bacterium]|nr:polyphenol oxidase family protein [Acidimicrobiales bacterium]